MSVQPDPMLGKTVAGRYRIVRTLGRGGMGTVYVASQEPLGREVALKLLRPNLADDAVAIERFRNEARIVASLHHPHVVAIHDFDTTAEGVLYIAMELLSGESLATRLRRVKRIAADATLPIVRDIARALSAAHRRGVVHRDLKPDNIMLVDAVGIGEHAKVLDFGIAKLFAREDATQSLTGTGMVPGTPGYISPEQIAGGTGDDPRSDLYALGITWFEMLTGTRPFKAEHALQLFMMQLNEAVPRPSSVAPDAQIPPAVDELVLWLTHKDPSARPATAEAFLHAIAERGSSSSPSPSSQPTVDATPQPSLALVSGTPHTGSAATVHAATPSRRPRVVRAAIVAAGVLIALALTVRIVTGGDAHERLASDVDGAFVLPVHTVDDEAMRTMRDALASYRRGDLQAADRLAAAVIETTQGQGPGEPGAHLIRALVALHDERWFETRAHGARALAAVKPGLQDRGEAPAAVALIELLQRASREKSADVLAAWNACGACADLAFGHVAIARVAFAADWAVADDARALLTKALAQEPGLTLAYAEEAAIHLASGDAAAALASVDNGLARSPGAPLLMLMQARALLALDRIDDAEAAAKRALTANPGRAGDLLLARIQLRRGNEDARKKIIDAQLASALPGALVQIAVDHGEALAGVGRIDEAIALFRVAKDSALDAGQPEVAAYVMLRATRVMSPALAGMSAAAASLSEQTSDVLDEPGLPEAARGVLAVVKSLIESSALLDTGALDDAQRKIDQLEALSDGQIAPRLRQKVTASVKVPLLLARADWAGALAQTDVIDEVCVRHAERARVFVAQHTTLLTASAAMEPPQGDTDANANARAEFAWIAAHEPLCRALGAQGLAVLSALALEVRFDSALGDHDGARDASRRLREGFPQAHRDLRALVDVQPDLQRLDPR